MCNTNLCCLLVINDSNLLHQLLCHIHDYFQFFSDFIGVIFLATLITFKAWNIFNYNNTIFIVYDVCCCAIESGTIFTIHTHIHHLFLRVFKSFSNLFPAFVAGNAVSKEFWIPCIIFDIFLNSFFFSP